MERSERSPPLAGTGARERSNSTASAGGRALPAAHRDVVLLLTPHARAAALTPPAAATSAAMSPGAPERLGRPAGGCSTSMGSRQPIGTSAPTWTMHAGRVRWITRRRP